MKSDWSLNGHINNDHVISSDDHVFNSVRSGISRRETSQKLNPADTARTILLENTTTLLINAVQNTTDTNTDQDDVMELKWLRAIFIIFYSIIFLFGVSGNSLVVFVVVRNKSMQSITNIFITNLAISDIMMCLLAVPFTPLSAFMKSWIFGDALCHILPMTLGVSVYVSTLTSTAIAIDR